MINFKVYYEALKNPNIVKVFSRPRIKGNLTLNPNESLVDKSIITNLPLRDYNRNQIRAMVEYIKRYTKYNSDENAKKRLMYLMSKYPTEMGIKMKLYLASLTPDSFDDATVV